MVEFAVRYYENHRSAEWARIIESLPRTLQGNILMKFFFRVFKIMSPRGKWIKLLLSNEEVASATMDLLLL